MSLLAECSLFLLAQLEDDKREDTTELLACGEDTLMRLRAAAVSSEPSAPQELSTLIDVSYTAMKSSSGSLCWRRLYTDASIFLALTDMSSVPPRPSEAISSLDKAIILAGAPGEGRPELIHLLISHIQSNHLTTHGQLAPSDVFCSESTHEDIILDSSHHEVDCLTAEPSLASFRKNLRKRPFVLRRYASEWPALQEHPWNSVDYLRAVAGPSRIVPVEIGSDYTTDDWSQDLMPWNEFISHLSPSDQESQSRSAVLYLAQHDLMKQFPALRDDVAIPDYVYTCPPAPDDYPEYNPPQNEEQLVLNVWLGPKGTVSPAHTDPFYNVYVQVVGYKTVWLAPPSVGSFMNPFSSSSPSNHPAANTTNPMMANTSSVDVFAKAEEFKDSSFEKHVVPVASRVTLGPGDLLFFPPGWWHGMKGETTSFSISMWF